MGRPLKIQKYSAMSGIFYDNTAQGTTAKAVNLDQGFNAFASPTALDVPTVVLPQPATTPLPFTGVVGGVEPPTVASAGYPIVKCEVNITNSASGQTPGQIIRQKGARKFMVATTTPIDPANAVVGVALRIAVVGDTEWASMGAPAGYGVGTIFTPVAVSGPGTSGTAQEVGTCVLVNDGTPTAGNMSISVSIADSTPTYLSKLTNKFAQDFNGGETGGSADTGDVWAETQVVNNIEYAANFFVDGEQFAKSGADVATWTSTNQNSNGTLTMAEVDKYTS